MTSIRFHGAAKEELRQIARFYKSISENVKMQFIDEVALAKEKIRKYPQSAPALQGLFRRQILHSFPYSLIYSVEEDHIYIIAVAHQSRKPDYWLDRLSEK